MLLFPLFLVALHLHLGPVLLDLLHRPSFLVPLLVLLSLPVMALFPPLLVAFTLDISLPLVLLLRIILRPVLLPTVVLRPIPPPAIRLPLLVDPLALLLLRLMEDLATLAALAEAVPPTTLVVVDPVAVDPAAVVEAVLPITLVVLHILTVIFLDKTGECIVLILVVSNTI